MRQKGTRAVLPQIENSSDYVVLIMNHATIPNKADEVSLSEAPAPVPTANKAAEFYMLDSGNSGDLVEHQILSYLKNGGSALLSPSLAQKVLDSLNQKMRPKAEPTVGLTQKEMSVLPYLRDGYSYNEIADFLNISINGVRFHVKNIYRKLKIKNRGELLRGMRNQ